MMGSHEPCYVLKAPNSCKVDVQCCHFYCNQITQSGAVWPWLDCKILVSFDVGINGAMTEVLFWNSIPKNYIHIWIIRHLTIYSQCQHSGVLQQVVCPLCNEVESKDMKIIVQVNLAFRSLCWYRKILPNLELCSVAMFLFSCFLQYAVKNGMVKVKER